MKKKRHTPEQIIRKLRTASEEQARGTGIEEVCRKLNSIMGFLFIGLPCLIHAILGRFTKRESKSESPFESLFPTFDTDDGKLGSFEFRTRLRELAYAISDRICDGIISDYGGEEESEDESQISIRFWAVDVEEFARRV